MCHKPARDVPKFVKTEYSAELFGRIFGSAASTIRPNIRLGRLYYSAEVRPNIRQYSVP
jgi:hypothetical protein